VYERWRHYAADPTYRALFDDEAMELSERVFGRIPGVEGLRSGPRAVRHVQSA
jgi:hypothetical protein